MSSVPTPTGPPVAAVDLELGRLSESLRRAARHGRRLSWFSWGFVLLTPLGFVLLVVLSIAAFNAAASGSSFLSTGGLLAWAVPVAFAPSFASLALAVREFLLARRETYDGWSSLVSADTPPASQSEGGWVAAVQQAQKTVTHIKNETELSFLPLVLGVLSLGVLAFETLLSPVLATAAVGDPGLILVAPLGGLALCVLLVPFYLSAKDWVESYQTLLDQQVRGLSQLEAEFLWRFTGTPA